MGSEQTEVVPRIDDETNTSGDDKNALDQSGSASKDMVSDSNVGNGSNEGGKPDDVVRSLPHVPYIYREDIVRHKKSGDIGIVNEVAGDADSGSSITDDEDDGDDDDNDDNEDDLNDNEEDARGDDKGDGDDTSVASRSGEEKKGGCNYKHETLLADQVRVLWMGDTGPIQLINDIQVIDRGFLHGDYVASASDATGQVGLVQDVNICVDLLAPDGSMIKDVSSKDLKRVREFAVGDHVVLGPWIGRVNDVLDNVTVLVDDGSVCKVMGADPLRLIPISKNMLDEDEQFPYYPGQRVRASSSSVFRDSRWLSGLWKPKRLEGTVTKVTTGSVFIYWIASAGYGPDSSTAPAEEQIPKNLKLLSCFAHANWQVGDWCLLPPSGPQSCFSTLGKGLSNLGLNDSVKSVMDSSQLENGCDSEEVMLEELDDNNEAMDTEPVVAPDKNSGNVAEFSSCTNSTSASKESVHGTRPLHRKKIRKVVFRREKKARKKEENFERAFSLISTRTKVDVAWQDGTIEHGVDSTMLIPIESPGDHEFVPEQYVVEKASDDVDNASDTRRVGVVKSVNAKERTACVRWLKPVARAEDPREFDKEEIVSVYELEGHPDFDYTYGDVVVRLSPPSVSAQNTSHGDSVADLEERSASNDTINARKSSECEKREDASAQETCKDFLDLSWVGNITGLRDGDIEVTWADGMVSTVGPQAIFVVGRDDDDDDSLAAGSEVSDGAASWETVNDDEMDSLENAQEEDELQNATDINSDVDESTDSNSRSNPAFSLPLAALDFVTRLATGIFSWGSKHIDSTDSRGENEIESQRRNHTSEERDSSDNSSSQKCEVDNYGAHCTDGKGEEHVSMEASILTNGAEALCNLRIENSDSQTCSEDDSGSFKRFDIAKDSLDHYFIKKNGQVNNGRKWFKKVQQDWSILQNNLPDGIYVRVYEDRMDLLRAVIVGAYGTPYQDGLFFFDFHLAPEYPDNPPSAYYHSGGWRINPNLYEEGKVCLSLLNTWTGRGNEVWDPKSSSILQVLVSLQGLVLNSKPYFNEAGYDKQIGTAEGEKNSLSYNENTFLLNCKMMMHLMRKPPKDFEELIQAHFRRRGYYILKACDAYMKGCLIGSLTKDASVSNEDNLNLTSVGFKLMLAKIVPKLYLALNGVGAGCQEFEHLLQS